MMKRYILLIFLVSLLVACQNKKPGTNQSTNERYVLRIVNQQQEVLLDTIEKKRKYCFVNIQLKLTNQTDSSLRYSTMSCSWRDNFGINNKDLHIMGQPCDQNIPVERALAPHQTSAFIIPIIFLTTPHKGNYPYQISMILNYDPLDLLTNIDASKHARKQIVNFLWSNKGVIPIK